MSAAASIIPGDEVRRIAAVRRYDILDTPPDGSFDRITNLAAQLFDVPISIVSVVDTDRIWFKSRHGLPDVVQVDRVPGLCASAILDQKPWVVTDAGTDPRTLANPLVAGEFGLRFYAGVPLTTVDGFNLGTLCVIDHQPHEVTQKQIDALTELAGIVVDELELRLATLKTVQREADLRREAEDLADALQASLLPAGAPELPGMDVASRYVPGERGLKVGGDFLDTFRLSVNDWGIVLGDACGRGARPASLAALTRSTIRALSFHRFNPASVLRDVNAVVAADNTGDLDDHYCTALFARLELDLGGAWLTVASAGHPLPMLVSHSGAVEEQGEPGLPLGLFDSTEATVARVGLGPRDSLVLYTDGITEARDASGEMFGEDRLRRCLATVAGQPADAIADAVVDAARHFAGGTLDDDVAVLVVTVPPGAGDDPEARLVEATGVPLDELELPDYARGGSPAR